MSAPGLSDIRPESKASPSLDGNRDAYQFVVFTLDQQQYALHLSSVERVVRIVEVTLLPRAPEIVLGVVNLRGRIIPVVNIRKRFRLAEREINLSDHLIIARASKRTVGLLADSVSDVVAQAEREIVAAEAILPGMEHLEGVAKLEDGMVLIHNLDRFLSLEEEVALEKALGTER